jgi:ABC-type sugar transport system ATPase subunit
VAPAVAAALASTSSTRTIEVGVRPEDVAVADGPGPGRSEARVVVVEPMGSETVLILECAGQRVTARAEADRIAEPGGSSWIAPALERAVFFDVETGRRLAAATAEAAKRAP